MRLFFCLVMMVTSSVFSHEYLVKFKDLDSLKSSDFANLRIIEQKIGAFAIINSNESLNELRSLASMTPEIEYIESNEVDYQLEGLIDNGRRKRQWGINGRWGVKAPEAWRITSGHKEVVVAIIDTGIDYKHRDLKDNMWVNLAEKNGTPGIDDDGNGIVDDIYGYNAYAKNGDPLDGHYHGTHCAGVVGAVANDFGIIGVMPEVSLMAIKIFSDRGRTTLESILRGIDYAINQGAHVLSNSWGGGDYSQAISDAIEKAKEAGILFVASAGNGNKNGKGYNTNRKKHYPDGYDHDNIISVGAIKSNGRRTKFSNYGSESVDLFAPGQNVISTVPNNRYRKLNGTSMAAPHVSAAAGLLIAFDSQMHYREVKRRLLDSVTKREGLKTRSVSGGVLNAYRALSKD